MSAQSATPAVATLGYPRIGRHRELKFAQESYWKGKTTEAELLATAATLRTTNWKSQQAAGATVIPSNDFSMYDQVLDTLVLVGATPTRFGNTGQVSLENYYKMARNSSEQTAMEMTKWFDTNYHYLVPEWSAGLSFTPDTRKPLAHFAEAKALGITTRPVVLGPLTLLALGKSVDGTVALELLPQLLASYKTVLNELAGAGAEWVQIDEPILVTDLEDGYAAAFKTAYAELVKAPVKLMLTTYFGGLGENADLALSLGTAGIHVDCVRAPEQIEAISAKIGAEQVLSLGVVDGRNIWIADLEAINAKIEPVVKKLTSLRVQLAPSCSLMHVPHDTADEKVLDPRVKGWLSFAQQKVEELAALAAGTTVAADAFAKNKAAHADRLAAETTHNEAVRSRIAALTDADFDRPADYPTRAKVQRDELGLPLFPTTTIGSFPQTADVRKQRAARRNNHITQDQYDQFLRTEIEACVRKQEEIGLDVLVHGEFERNDMVEYFGELLDGFAFTENGWVQSYGSRCVKPPVIYGDVSRPKPMTVFWSQYAASITKKNMKGMLTGPVTILQWSFVRDDIHNKDVTYQIALALRDEVVDLQNAGIRIIQVDEPALREGLPLREAEWAGYLDWAVKAFKLATAGVENGTQIHTHMCYCEFEDVLQSIADLDADVISMESARSRMEMLDAFKEHGYPNEIGPGIYDIHSPRVPSAEEMTHLLELALGALKPEQIWVNPDCGLKTRGWEETNAALTNMVKAANNVRESVGAKA